MSLLSGKLFRIASTSVVVLGLSLTSAVAATTYTDRSLFEPTLGTSVTDDYSNAGYGRPPIATSNRFTNEEMSDVLGETEYTATSIGYPINSNSVFGVNSGNGQAYCAGCNGSFNLGFTSTSVGTSDGVFGVGFDFLNLEDPFYTAFVTFGDGTTANYALPQSNSFQNFFGITSDLLVTSMHLGLIDGATTQLEGLFVIDNLTIGSAAPLSAVPLPAALPLYGAGMALLGLAGWHRKRKLNAKVA
ncbi:hypothetical protein NBZ79_09380 [Sneathiella marina]|uniref:PEP-CTERM protein-sorting domain-containing protein n=1 Tax=Sneathiella marina TaxID=2950108 RepID=A0ABY4W7M2_9PROT|nr:hypothetical protein [Sneathiella marina]USG63186.1 hypothetical protein NBZ79_09380 [Sneathiella marina]